jgi:hypothetical protein
VKAKSLKINLGEAAIKMGSAQMRCFKLEDWSCAKTMRKERRTRRNNNNKRGGNIMAHQDSAQVPIMLDHSPELPKQRVVK